MINLLRPDYSETVNKVAAEVRERLNQVLEAI